MENPFENGPTFVGHIGIELTEASADMAAGLIVLTENHQQPYGVVHGGVYCTLAETLASTGAALWAIQEGMAGAVGVTNKTDFLRPTTGGTLTGTATPIHRGRSQQLWQVNITRDDGKLAAQSQVRLQNITDTDFG